MCGAGAPPAGAAKRLSHSSSSDSETGLSGQTEPDNRGFRWIGFWNVTSAGLPEASIRVGTWRNGGTPRRSFTYGSFCQNKRKHQRREVILVRCHQEWLRMPVCTEQTLGSPHRTPGRSKSFRTSDCRCISCRLLCLFFRMCKASSCVLPGLQTFPCCFFTTL